MGKTFVFDDILKADPSSLKGRERLVGVKEMPPFVTLNEVDNGAKIEDTAYYKMFIQRGNAPEDARKYVNQFLKKRQEAAATGNFGPVSVSIDSHGNLIINRGYENSAIAAKYVPELEVRVASRDPAWGDLVTMLYDVRNERFSYMPVFQPEEHPEFKGWSFARGSERAKLISQDIGKVGGQKWLDVGSLTGYHSRMLEFAGTHAEGIEMHQPYVKIAELLNYIQGTNAVYHNQELLQWLDKNQKRQFDGILCLSIIHNIAQNGNPEGAKQAFRTLSRMAPRMYFDIGQANEGSKVTSTGLDLTETNLERFVRENSAYTSVTIIGRDHSYYDRTMFRLSR